MSRRVAIIGSAGIPARYGGFETFTEELAPRLVERGWDVTVYCRRGRTGGSGVDQRYRGVELVHTPYVRARSLETLTHEATSLLRSLPSPPDLYYILGTRGAFLAPIARATGRPVVMHTDGVEWMRRKWGPGASAFLKASDRSAARVIATRLVADAHAMADVYRERYDVEPTVIPYGADVLGPPDPEILARHGLIAGAYDLVLCRLEPENNVDIIVREHRAANRETELVIVGATSYDGPYQRALRAMEEPGRVRFVGAVYDGADDLYAGAARYLHGHEAGGLNPSLLRAMGAGVACFALDTPFAREALGDTGTYWTLDRGSLADVLASGGRDGSGQAAAQRVEESFTWDRCTDLHHRLFEDLLGSATRGRARA